MYEIYKETKRTPTKSTFAKLLLPKFIKREKCFNKIFPAPFRKQSANIR